MASDKKTGPGRGAPGEGKSALARQNMVRGQALRGRDPEILVRLAREQTTEALRHLVNIMQDLEQPGAVRVRAIELLLERGWGKTPQQIFINDDSSVGMAAIPIMDRVAALRAAMSGGETIELESSQLLEITAPAETAPAAAAPAGRPGEDCI